MKRFIAWFKPLLLALMGVLLLSWSALAWVPPATAAPQPESGNIGLCSEDGPKIDLNNANLAAFRDCPGFYPTLATQILRHGPYQTVEDVLNISDLTNQQTDLLKANMAAFTVSDAVVPLEQRMPPHTTMPAH